MYLVIELQKLGESSLSVPTPIYSSMEMPQAESEFHRLCSIAAVSEIPRHTIMLINDEGFIHKQETFEQ